MTNPILDKYGITLEEETFIPEDDSSEVKNILWAEAAGDPEGRNAKLNTYNKARRKGESLLSAMKRVSSAYRTKSNQYKKAKNQDFNLTEKGMWNQFSGDVDNFSPDPDWEFVHHENYDLNTYRPKKTITGLDETGKKMFSKKVFNSTARVSSLLP